MDSVPLITLQLVYDPLDDICCETMREAVRRYCADDRQLLVRPDYCYFSSLALCLALHGAAAEGDAAHLRVLHRTLGNQIARGTRDGSPFEMMSLCNPALICSSSEVTPEPNRTEAKRSTNVTNHNLSVEQVRQPPMHTHNQHEGSEAKNQTENYRLPEDIWTLKLTPGRKPIGTIVLEILPEKPNGTRH